MNVGFRFKLSGRYLIIFPYQNPCKRKVKFGIPDDYVADNRANVKVFDAGTMNMQIKFKGEETKCLG